MMYQSTQHRNFWYWTNQVAVPGLLYVIDKQNCDMRHYYLLLGLELTFQFNPAGFCLQLSNCKGSERGTLDSLAQYYTHTLRLYSAEDTHQGIHKYIQTCLLRALQLMLSVTRSNTNTYRGAHTEALTQRHPYRGTHTEAPTQRHSLSIAL